MIFIIIVKLQIQVIRICEHKIKKGFCLNGSLPGYTFESEPAASMPVCMEVSDFSQMTIYATKNGCLEFIHAVLPPGLWLEFGSQKKF